MAEQEAAKAQEAARLARETALTHDVMQREESERRLAEAEEARQHSLAKFISELSVLPMLPGETADQRAARLERRRDRSAESSGRGVDERARRRGQGEGDHAG